MPDRSDRRSGIVRRPERHLEHGNPRIASLDTRPHPGRVRHGHRPDPAVDDEADRHEPEQESPAVASPRRQPREGESRRCREAEHSEHPEAHGHAQARESWQVEKPGVRRRLHENPLSDAQHLPRRKDRHHDRRDPVEQQRTATLPREPPGRRPDYPGNAEHHEDDQRPPQPAHPDDDARHFDTPWSDQQGDEHERDRAGEEEFHRPAESATAGRPPPGIRTSRQRDGRAQDERRRGDSRKQVVVVAGEDVPPDG